MRRGLLVGSIVGVILCVGASTAYASCVPPTGTREERLAAVAAGRTDYAVAFVGTVLRRQHARRIGGAVYTPVDFSVTRAFAGVTGRRATVLVDGGCMSGTCAGDSEAIDYGAGPQLVLADRDAAGRALSADDCSDAGMLTASEAKLLKAAGAPLRRTATPVPRTGAQVSTAVDVAAALVAVGVVAMLSGLLRARRRRGHPTRS
jgi:hypothetical protein